MRSLSETRARWEATFVNKSNLSELRKAVRRSKQEESPCALGLRSVCWKAFLLFENLDLSTWSKTLWDSRSAYTSIRGHLLRDIKNSDDVSAIDPLADDETSPWNNLRQDEITRAEIFQDVERCMPENLYFREPSTQCMLLDILFVFCKLNPDTGYRQGMHEVLAPILWVVSRDAVDSQNLEEQSEIESDSNELVQATLDSRYVEHDAFTLFCVIMQTVKSFYEIGSTGQGATLNSPANAPIIQRSKRIHEEYLRRTDPRLAEHLTAIEVLPQIFLIRWVRLLFGREFPLDDVLSVWDILFAEDPTLALVDYICVAMLLRIRWQLIDADYSSALTLLLRYPVPSDPNGPLTFVGDALYLRHNLSQDGGAQIISTYSGKSPSSPQQSSVLVLSPRRSLTKESRGSPMRKRTPSSSRSPRRSPAKFIQDQGGIESILQEAAKGVYNRGETWGVTKALRGAVQGLQTGTNSPKKVSDRSHWPIDNHKTPSSSFAQVAARIKTLEDRNKGLSKMLENAIEDLWKQQKEFAKEKAEVTADALSLTIAKLQFVQIYLEDSTMALSSEDAQTGFESSKPPSLQVSAPRANESADESKPTFTRTTHQPEPNRPSTPKAIKSLPPPSTEVPHSTSIQPQPSTQPSPSPSTPPPNPKSHRTPNLPSQPPSSLSPHPRPSLGQSSFSWILGEDQRKSDFVAASPFSSTSEVRRKAGFLFGDTSKEEEDAKKEIAASTTRRGRNHSRMEGEEEEDGEGFTLGVLSGGREERGMSERD